MNRFQELFNKKKAHFLSEVKNASVKERIAKLKKIKKWIQEHDKEIGEAVYAEFKKSAPDANISEIKPVLVELEKAIKNLYEWTDPEYVGPPLYLLGSSAKVYVQPKGVVLIISPWNFPFNLTVGPLVAAIAAGNCVFIKPSELSTHTGPLIKKMVDELFKEEEVSVHLGEVDVAKELLELPFNHIFFTGSPQVGKQVMAAAAKHLCSVTLELGGKNPVIVDENVNIKDAAYKLTWGKFYNCGQSCVAPNYLFVPESMHDQFVEAVKISFKKLYPGDNTQKNPDFSRVINNKHFHRVKNLVETAKQEGAKVVLGAQYDEAENYVAPTVLTDVQLEHKINREELFGPVMPIIKYKNVQDVVDYINHEEKPLALYVFTNSSRFAKKIIQNTSAGTTCINETTAQFLYPNIPFGGDNASGIGKGHGYYSFLEFSNKRSVLKQRIGFTIPKLIYPPYNKLTKKLIDITVWWL